MTLLHHYIIVVRRITEYSQKQKSTVDAVRELRRLHHVVIILRALCIAGAFCRRFCSVSSEHENVMGKRDG